MKKSIRYVKEIDRAGLINRYAGENVPLKNFDEVTDEELIHFSLVGISEALYNTHEDHNEKFVKEKLYHHAFEQYSSIFDEENGIEPNPDLAGLIAHAAVEAFEDTIIDMSLDGPIDFKSLIVNSELISSSNKLTVLFTIEDSDSD